MQPTTFPSLRQLFGITDEQIMGRVGMQDDETAFADLMKRWQEPVLRLCTRMTGDSHRAEDLSQEVFARVFDQRKKYQPRSKFSTWLWRIALNLCYDELRARRHREESWVRPDDHTVNPMFVSPGLPPDRHALQEEQGALVRNALLSLPEAYRTVLVLRHYQDLKFRQIAEVLEIPEGTVKSRMAEALSQLSRRLMVQLREPSQPGRQESDPHHQKVSL